MSYDTHIEWPTAELAGLLAGGAIRKGDRVLDLGCGEGTEASFLGAMGCNVLAVDTDEDLLRRARTRRESLPARVRRRIGFRKADARRFRERAPGKFDVVVERLLLQNLAPVGQLRIIRTAAYALHEAGAFIMRTRPGRDDDEPEDIARDWGAIDKDQCSIDDRAWDLIDRYFYVGPPVQFGALVTDPTMQADGVLTIRAISMIVIVATRNGRPFRTR